MFPDQNWNEFPGAYGLVVFIRVTEHISRQKLQLEKELYRSALN